MGTFDLAACGSLPAPGSHFVRPQPRVGWFRLSQVRQRTLKQLTIEKSGCCHGVRLDSRCGSRTRSQGHRAGARADRSLSTRSGHCRGSQGRQPLDFQSPRSAGQSNRERRAAHERRHGAHHQARWRGLSRCGHLWRLSRVHRGRKAEPDSSGPPIGDGKGSA